MDYNNSYSIKNQIIKHKHFWKFYKTKFIPITLYENETFKNHKNLKIYSPVLMFCNLLLVRHGFNRVLLHANKKPEIISTNTMKHFINTFTRLSIIGLVSLYSANLIANHIVFNTSDFIRQRLKIEFINKIDRKNILEQNQNNLYEDYPLISLDKRLLTDEEYKFFNKEAFLKSGKNKKE